MTLRHLLSAAAYFICILSTLAINPTATDYPWDDCRGSAKPYPTPRHAFNYPDTLTPVMINHVGRHGARYPAGPSHTNVLLKALADAQKAGSITPLGYRLKALAENVRELSSGRWGALDSLGMAEQQGIAARMYASYPELFQEHTVAAISSYVPRCVMSMYEFTHQLSRLDPKVEINAMSGPRFSPLMRFFSHNKAYKHLVNSDTITAPLHEYYRQFIPLSPLRKVLGDKFDYESPEIYTIALAEYSVLAGLEAMGIHTDISPYLTRAEYNSLWNAFNLKQYLTHSASTISTLPADIAAPLLKDLTDTFEQFIASPEGKPTVRLRFGHAETLMPLLSLMRLPGCHYLTYNLDTVGLHWLDFHIVPMAANLQLILFRSDTGHYYLRADLNETPTPLIPGTTTLYTPWPTALTNHHTQHPK